MATKVAELVVDVKAETASAMSNLRNVDNKVRESSSTADKHTGLIAGMFGKLTAPISGVTNAAGGLVSGLGKIGIAGAGLGILATGVTATANAFVGGVAQFEDYNVQFSTLLRNAPDFQTALANNKEGLSQQELATKLAGDRMKELAQFGASTPFELPGVVEANKVLQGFGLQADNTTKRFGFSRQEIMTITGDLASGTGTDFAEMATNIGKFSAGATGEAISRFQELGVVTKTELQNMGLNFDKGGALVIKSQEDMDKATGILLTAIKSKYGGLMIAQSATFNGMISNLQDWVSGTIREAAKPIFEPMKAGLSGLLDFLNKNNDAIVAGLQKVTGIIGTVLGSGIKAVIGNMQSIFTTARDSVLTFASAFEGNWTDAENIRPLHRVIGEVGTVLGELWTKLQPVIQAFWSLHEVLNPVSLVFGVVTDLLSGGGLGTVLDGLGDKVIAVGDAFGINLRPAVDTVINFIMQTALPALDQFGQFFSTVIIPAVLQFADFMTSTVLPAIGQLGEFIFNNVLPALSQFADWLGQQLGPLFNTIGQTITTTVLPALDQFGQFFVTTILPALSQVAEYIGSTVVPFVQKLAETFIAAITMIVPVIGTLVDIILNNVIPVLVQWWTVIATVLKPVFDVLINVITNVLLPAFLAVVSFITGTLVPAFQKIFEFLSGVIIPIFQNVVNYINGTLIPNFQTLANNVTTVWNNIVTGIQNAWNTISGIWNNIINFITGTLVPAFQNFLTNVQNVWNNIISAIQNAWNTISGVWNEVTSFLAGAFTAAFNTIKTTIDTVWTGITSAISNAWTTIQNTFNNVVSFLGTTLSNAFTTLQTTISTVWTTIGSGIDTFIGDVKTKFNDVINFFHDLPGNIVNAVGNLGNTLFSAGQSLIQGLINGIKNLHIPVPHISVSFSDSSFGPITVPIPSFSVAWYKTGGIFPSPQLIGVGDASSPEAVIPIDMLKTFIGESIRDNFPSQTNSTRRLEMVIDLRSDGNVNLDESSMTTIFENVVMRMLDNQGQDIVLKRNQQR